MNTGSLIANPGIDPKWIEEDRVARLTNDLNQLHFDRRNSRPRDAPEHGSPGFAGGFANPRDKALPQTPPGSQAAFTSPRYHPHGGGFAIPQPNGSPSPAMPMPVPMLPGRQGESRTMHYARNGGYGIPEIPTGGPSLPIPQPVRTDRVHSAPPMPQAAQVQVLDTGSSSDEVEIISSTACPKYSGRKNSNSEQPLSIISPPKSSSRRKSDPITPTKRRSSVASPAGTPGTPGGSKSTQCHGTTLQGERCKKRVAAKRPALATKISASASASDSDDSSQDDVIELYCGTHAAQIAKDSVYFAPKNQQRVEFNDYIPIYLSPETKVALRVEMRKKPSDKDADGYIYAFHIQDKTTPKLAHLKVGRTNNIGKRMSQWGRQCGSREQILRGVWPSVDPEDLVKGKMKPPPAGPYMARLERLVHLELADLVANRQYLCKEWKDMCELEFEDAAVPLNERKAKSDEKCKDCDRMHKEIFSFPIVEKGDLVNQEWNKIVKPVIERWGGFVEQYV